MENLTTNTGESVDEFFLNYKNALKAQRDSTIKQLEQQRRNDYASIMGAANRRGMLYSNFPEREKIKYNVATFMPAYVKANTSYTTGLDSLRANMVNFWNQKKAYDEAAAELASY